MTVTKSNNIKIAKNTLFLYVRMLFLMCINLYTSRILLQSLGVEDYGIYNAVAGFITMFSIISSSMSAAISRYITFVLGQKDLLKLKRVFSTSLVILFVLSFIIVTAVEIIGVWFLNTKMTIPEGREFASNIVLHFSLLSFVINLLYVPYNASIIAHERMEAFAYIGIYEGLANLLIAFLVSISLFDALMSYSFLICISSIMTFILYITYCKRHFEECTFSFRFEKSLFKEMFGFAGWNFIGSIAGLLRSQGLNLLFNVYNGPIVNAARGLAVQVSNAMLKFSSSFYTAVQPQITKSYAANDVKESCSLAVSSSRLAFYLLLLLSIPILFEAPFLLKLWLKEIPDYTIAFVRIIVLYSVFESFSQPLIHLMLATGNIKKYQILVGGINLVNFPVAWVILYLGYRPEIAQSSVLVFTFATLFTRVFMLKHMIAFPARLFLQDTVLRCVVIFIVCCVAPFIMSRYLQDSTLISCLKILVTELVSVSVILIIGLKKNERNLILTKLPVVKKCVL